MYDYSVSAGATSEYPRAIYMSCAVTLLVGTNRSDSCSYLILRSWPPGTR
jgi:hypothetical protein